MSNLGLEQAFEAMGLTLHRARVGDKYVLEDMLRLGANLGGEQSGHTILLDDCPTGDGLLTSLKMCEVLAATGAPLSELVSGYREYPQILLNVPVTRREPFDNFSDITHALASAQEELGRTGRINLRFSGTEMLARVMAEGRDPDVIQRCANRVADAVTRHLGS
jgi:phosphoglucosamine mutase